MSFSTPLALLGLLTLPVIAALHMLRARSRQSTVASLSLWKFLSPQMSGASARRIPLTWLLFLDLLIAAALSLALAGPRLGWTQTVLEGRHLILLIDTSTSMGATDHTPSRFEAARSDWTRLIGGRGGQDVVTVIEFGRNTAVLADSRSPDFDSQFAALSQLTPGGREQGVEAPLALARASADPSTPAEVHIFTDAAFPAPASTIFDVPLLWHLYGSSGENQAVLTVQAVTLSSSKFQVFARFANFGSQAATRTAVLTAGGQVLAETIIALEPGTSLTQSWEILGTAQSVRVALSGADALPADDAGEAVVPAAAGQDLEVTVGLITEQPGPLLRALEAVPGSLVQVIAPEDYLPGSLFDLTVFRGALPERWPAGTVLVVDPPPNSSLLGETRSTNVTDQPFPQPDPLLEGVDFTGVRWSRAWTTEHAIPGLDALLSAGRQPLLLHGQTGLTDLVLLLAEVAGETGTPSAFARHPAFPVLIANIVGRAAGADLPSQASAGDALPLPAADRYPSIRITDPGGQTIELGPLRAPVWDGFGLPGLYEIVLTDRDANEAMFLVAAIAGDLAESDVAPQEWPATVESPGAPAASTEQPVSLTPWLLGLVAVLLLLEAWFAWR